MAPDLHERVAAALGWTEAEAQRFSLPALRDLLRFEHPKLAGELSAVVQSGSCVARPAPLNAQAAGQEDARIMDMREARRRVAAGAAKVLDFESSENLWLAKDDAGNELAAADKARMRAAFDGLVAELRRRGELR